MSYHEVIKENDNIYLNVIFNGPTLSYSTSGGLTTTNNEDPVIGDYNVNKTIPILDKCSDYYCSVVRFTIPMNVVPLYIFPVVPGSGTTNTSPLIIGISLSGTDYPVNLIYVPDNNVPQVNQNNPNQLLTSPFYVVYSYLNLITSFNTALTTVYGNAGSPGGAGAPYLFLDPVTQLINLVVPMAFVTASATIFYNEYSQKYLDSLPFFWNGNNQLLGKDYTIKMPTTANYIYNTTFYKYQEEYPTLIYWDSLRKLFITTNSIPIVNEYIPSQQGQGVSASIPIITDFVPNLATGGDARSIAYYVPSTQYRLIDMISDLPLYKLDLHIFWEDPLGNFYPIYISIAQQASMKIAFIRKSLYKGKNLLLMK